MNRVELDRAIEAAPHGKPRMVLLRKAWEEADKEKYFDAQVKYRMENMSESSYNDDELEIYIV